MIFIRSHNCNFVNSLLKLLICMGSGRCLRLHGTGIRVQRASDSDRFTVAAPSQADSDQEWAAASALRPPRVESNLNLEDCSLAGSEPGFHSQARLRVGKLPHWQVAREVPGPARPGPAGWVRPSDRSLNRRGSSHGTVPSRVQSRLGVQPEIRHTGGAIIT